MAETDERLCIRVRPSLWRMVCGMSVYVGAGLLVMSLIDPFALGWGVLNIPFVGIFLAAGLLVLSVVMQHLCTLEIDASGFQQRNAVQWYFGQVTRTDHVAAVPWNAEVAIVTHVPWLISICRVRPEGGVLSRLRHLFRPKRFVFLPRRWLIADADELIAALEQFAPSGHPLRRFYGVRDSDGIRTPNEWSA